MRSIEEAPYINFLSEEFQADPGPFMDAARAQSGLARTPFGAVVIRHSLVQELLADPRLDSSLLFIVRLQGLNDGPIYELLSRALLSVDGEDHTRLRKLVSRAFTPRSVEVLRASMRQRTNELIDRFAARGQCEFVADFAEHYPIEMICELLGVPVEDHEQFGKWASGLTWVLSMELSMRMAEIESAFLALGNYMEAFIEARRRAPQDDLVTRLIQAEEGGDHLSPVELRAMIGALIFAGYDTTRNQLGIALWLFAQHPEQWQLLAEQPELIGAAVDEVLRFMGTVTVAPRIAREELVVDDYHVPAGTILTLSTAAANHDPSVHELPERFDITAKRSEPPLTFGGGPHYCLGANLARAEMQEALTILSTRLRDLSLDGAVTWRPRSGIYGPNVLPLRFAAA